MNKSHLLGALSAGLCVLFTASVQAVAVSGQGTWESTLQGRDLDGNPSTYEAYYDTVLDITWLTDAHLAASQLFGLPLDTSLGPYPGDPSGYDGYIWTIEYFDMNWPGAKFWVDEMNNASYLGSNDWRLPTLSELASMYTDTLGNTPSSGSANTGPFQNMQWDAYWSGDEYQLNTDMAWFFAFDLGGSGGGFADYDDKSYGFSGVWTVLDGDISAVPIPSSVWLLGSGLLGLIGVARRKMA